MHRPAKPVTADELLDMIRDQETDGFLDIVEIQEAAGMAVEKNMRVTGSRRRFRIEIEMDPEGGSQALVTLRALGADRSVLEGVGVTVRERYGKILLKGEMRLGYISRIIDDISDMDISCLTVIPDGGIS